MIFRKAQAVPLFPPATLSFCSAPAPFLLTRLMKCPVLLLLQQLPVSAPRCLRAQQHSAGDGVSVVKHSNLWRNYVPRVYATGIDPLWRVESARASTGPRPCSFHAVTCRKRSPGRRRRVRAMADRSSKLAAKPSTALCRSCRFVHMAPLKGTMPAPLQLQFLAGGTTRCAHFWPTHISSGRLSTALVSTSRSPPPFFTLPRKYWIGLNRQSSGFSFTWQDGSSSSGYNFFYPNEVCLATTTVWQRVARSLLSIIIDKCAFPPALTPRTPYAVPGSPATPIMNIACGLIPGGTMSCASSLNICSSFASGLRTSHHNIRFFILVVFARCSQSQYFICEIPLSCGANEYRDAQGCKPVSPPCSETFRLNLAGR